MVAAHVDLFAQEVPQRFPKLQGVFEKSKRDFWNETTDVNWEQGLTLPADKRAALARVLSIIYYGERAAVIVGVRRRDRELVVDEQPAVLDEVDVVVDRVGQVVDMQKLAPRRACAPDGHTVETRFLCFVKAPDQCGQNMTVFRMKIITGSVEIGGHD